MSRNYPVHVLIGWLCILRKTALLNSIISAWYSTWAACYQAVFFFLSNILFMMSFGGLDKHTETSHIFLVEYWCVSEALDYLRIILHVLFGGIKSSDLYNTNPILPLQHNSVQYPLEDFVITASSCGLCVAQLGKSKATEVESIKIASVSCLSSLSHAFNFFPPSPILPCTGIFPPPSPPPPLQMEIHSTPSSSCSSSSSHLIPPPLSGPEPRQ